MKMGFHTDSFDFIFKSFKCAVNCVLKNDINYLFASVFRIKCRPFFFNFIQVLFFGQFFSKYLSLQFIPKKKKLFITNYQYIIIYIHIRFFKKFRPSPINGGAFFSDCLSTKIIFHFIKPNDKNIELIVKSLCWNH